MITILVVLWFITFRLSPQFQFALVGYLLAIMFFLVWTDEVGKRCVPS